MLITIKFIKKYHNRIKLMNASTIFTKKHISTINISIYHC